MLLPVRKFSFLFIGRVRPGTGATFFLGGGVLKSNTAGVVVDEVASSSPAFFLGEGVLKSTTVSGSLAVGGQSASIVLGVGVTSGSSFESGVTSVTVDWGDCALLLAPGGGSDGSIGS